MRRKVLLPLVIACLVLGVLPASAGGGGVHPLRGRWDLVGDSAEGTFDLRLLVTTVREDPDDATAFLATGCLISVDSDVTAPMSMRAIDTGEGTMELTFYSTVIRAPGAESAVTRFDGVVDVSGKGVSDDVVGGGFLSDGGGGSWEGTHHDRRKPKCTGASELLHFQGDTYTAQNPGGSETLLSGMTQIVSSGMRVSSPSMGTVFAPAFTDIFTPGVDFVSEFRFLGSVEGSPAIGEVFSFTLLDVFGDPIPGADSTDVWNGCFQGAPGNLLVGEFDGEYLELSWDPVDLATGFDPENEVGFYQIESSGGYGAVTESGSTSHLIPWDPFGGYQPGQPNGFDFGASLSEFGEGDFELAAIAFSVDVGPGGAELACQVRGEPLIINIDEGNITVLDP